MDDAWISIQAGTFRNWCNEQLKVGGRSVNDINVDFCDGVNLVALVEALQFRKIGKVFTKPTSKIQQLQNVSLALTAITDDNVKLVNVGGDDIVNGNAKIILGLIWTLVQRYQIGKKSKAPPKKLMLAWFRNVVPELDFTNFTADWNDGVALHALLDHLKPGTSPEWQKLSRANRVENCRRAMVLAKDVLNIPRVISPEDFASSALDELSAMTYLSYFVKFESPGYYHTLNWACKQLRTTNITNLTTDWNDGYYLCGIVHSLGGQVPGWPNLDRSKKLENCEVGLAAAKSMEVEIPLTAKEMTDVNVDHLSIMSLLSRLATVKPKKSTAEKLELRYNFDNVKIGTRHEFQIVIADSGVDTKNVVTNVSSASRDVTCDVKWTSKAAMCTFTPTDVGSHKLTVVYQGVEIKSCPVDFVVKGDHSKCALLTTSGRVVMGDSFEVKVDPGGSWVDEVVMESTSPNGELRYLNVERKGDLFTGTVQPRELGVWRIHVYIGEEEIQGSPVQLKVSDPQKAWLSGPESGFVGDVIMYNVHCKGTGEGEVTGSVTRDGSSEVTFDLCQDPENSDLYILTFTVENKGEHCVSVKFDDVDIKGSPCRIITIDPGEIRLAGEGLLTGIKGDKCHFSVDLGHVAGDVTAEVMDGTERLEVESRQPSLDVYEYTYVPPRAGNYAINIYLDGRLLPGSPFHPRITDKSRVFLMDDLTDQKDENDHLALECGAETVLNYNIADAGPGQFTAEVLSPDGRLPVDIRNPDQDTVQVGFTAKVEGDHYIHLYWSNVALDQSPILAYCPGPVLPVNHALVVITGDGHQTARATVPAEFLIDGRKAGPGIPRVRMRGVKTDVDVEMKAMKYDRYKCKYAAPYPGGYLLQVEWSSLEVPGSPFKVNVTNKGHSDKVTVEGAGLRGGYVGQELRAIVDTTLAGNGEVISDCFGLRHNARCDQIDHRDGKYTLRIFPTEACRHTLQVKYDGEHVPGSPFHIPVGEPPDPRNVRVYGPGSPASYVALRSPFHIPVGEPPDPRNVRVYGPGIEPGVIQRFESKFIVETYGAGAGQLAVRIRGPRGAFRVEMKRDREDERTIVCRYDPEEPGEYIVTITWSGVHVPGSPFTVPIFGSMESLYKHAKETKQIELIADYQWKEEI